MKKFKIIPVLAVSMLLTACQTGVKVSKPKFAAEGSSMKLEDFVAEFIDLNTGDYGPAIKDSEFFQKDPKIGSKEMKGVDSYSKVTTVTLDGKQRSKTEHKDSAEQVEQGDSANHVIIAKVKEASEDKSSDLYGKSSASSSGKRELTYQEGKGKYGGKEGVEGFIATDDIAKEFAVVVPFVEESPINKDNWYSFMVAQQGSALAEEILDVLPETTDEKELAKYSYFKNDTVYTVKYSSADDPAEVKVTIDEKETVARTITTKVEKIFQLDVKEGKWAWKSSIESTVTTEDLVDYSEFGLTTKKGQKQVVEEKTYEEVHLNDKKVSLKAKDLSKYQDRG